MEINDKEFRLLHQLLKESCGIDIPHEKRYLFETRLKKLIEEEGCADFLDLYNRLNLQQNEALQRKLFAAMSTNETSFFRDPHYFDIIGGVILPGLIKNRKKASSGIDPLIRIWSVGCSSGQEAYSLAILALEAQERCGAEGPMPMSVFATDISQTMIRKARGGVYSDEDIQKGLDEKRRDRYFTRIGKGWQTDRKLREMIRFAESNLSQLPSGIGQFDLILCRNVLIYFSTKLKIELLSRLCRLLTADGYLIMGASENLICISEDFVSERHGSATVYRRKKT